MERKMYYFVKKLNDKNSNTEMIISNDFLGDINDTITYHNFEYIIVDYAEEVM